jgi:hypothetical protein
MFWSEIGTWIWGPDWTAPRHMNWDWDLNLGIGVGLPLEDNLKFGTWNWDLNLGGGGFWVGCILYWNRKHDVKLTPEIWDLKLRQNFWHLSLRPYIWGPEFWDLKVWPTLWGLNFWDLKVRPFGDLSFFGIWKWGPTRWGLYFWDLKLGSGFETYNLGLDFWHLGLRTTIWDLFLGSGFETYNLGLNFWDLKLGYEFQTYTLGPELLGREFWDPAGGVVLSGETEDREGQERRRRTTRRSRDGVRHKKLCLSLSLSLSLRNHTLLLLPLPLSALACSLAPRVCLLFSSSLLCFFSSSCFSPKSQQGRETLTGAPVASISLCSCRTCAFPALGSGES